MTHDGDRVWLVTGASTGIGRAAAEVLSARGTPVVATARRPETLADLVESYSDHCLSAPLDVLDRASVAAAVRLAVDRFGHLDVVLHCAGVGLIGAVEESSDEEIGRVFDVNLFGTISVLKAALPHMRKRRHGHLAVVTSFGAFEGHAGVGVYDATKAGLERLCEALAAEVSPLGIAVSLVEPGVVKTNFRTTAIIRAGRRIPTYEEILAARRATIERGYAAGVDEPREVVRAMLAALDQPEPPRHLVLGSRAINQVRDALHKTLRDIDRWEEYSNLRPPPGGTVNSTQIAR